MIMKRCMNVLCGATSSVEWKTGWRLRSGELAVLCHVCGYAFEQRMYCEEFHKDDSGWRKCATCGKGLHCGCIASLSSIELLDAGGVKCIQCARNPVSNFSWNVGKCNNYRPCTATEDQEGIFNHKDSNSTGGNQLSMPHSSNSALDTLKQEGFTLPTAEAIATTQPPLPLNSVIPDMSGPWTGGATWPSTIAQTSMGSFLKDRTVIANNNMQTRDNHEVVARPSLNTSLGSTSGNLQFTSGTFIDRSELKKMSNAFSQGSVSPSHLQTQPKLPFSPASDTNMSIMSPLCVARPPSDGRGRNQRLPRYLPKMTDQELLQISGDSNCSIVPLFEKVLSASDASRIGRLVLPKACAEAYFPPITQSEGLPIKTQDVKGKEWVFQFRFWPNNNSRMYVLEGVAPCLQSMQLQAGDTVTFSRKDPEGKLIMGFRKAANLSIQDPSVTHGCAGPPQPLKGSTDTHLNVLSGRLDFAGGNANMHNSEKCGQPTNEGFLPSSMMRKQRKKRQKTSGDSKRLRIEKQDAQPLKLKWEEVQALLRPPPNAKPSIVVVDGVEFEEYEEPPVIGKTSVFASQSSGVIDQWAQCDSCSKWRRLPADFFIPPQWTCSDNASDPARWSCSAPDELSPGELEQLSYLSKDPKKRKNLIPAEVNKKQESCDLGAVANGNTKQESCDLGAVANAAADSESNPNEPGTSDIAITKKHPRHRLGCSCIVCCQPASGKGNHKSTCTCTVCMTVKRRFKTMMMRKKKRHSETEMGLKPCQENNHNENGKSKLDNGSLQTNADDGGSKPALNSQPECEEVLKMKKGQGSLTNLLNLESFPLDDYMKENGLEFLIPEEQASSEALHGQVSEEITGRAVC